MGLGTATFQPGYGLNSVVQPDDYNISLLRTAVERGIFYIDTAPSYGNSENLVGEVAGLLSASNVRLCTKISLEKRSLGSEEIIIGVKSSLDRLRRDSVDTLLVHSATREVICGSMASKGLDRLKQDGHTRLIGVSTYGVENARLALSMDWCDVVQVEFSILNQSVIRSIRPKKRVGQELVVRSVLCKGLLTERAQYASSLSSQIKQRLCRLTQHASSWGYTLPELAIRFALDTPGIDVVLVGMSNLVELEVALSSNHHAPLDSQQMRVLAEFDCSEIDWAHPERWESF